MPQTEPQMNLLSAVETASILGKNKATVNRWASEGTLPYATKAPGVRGAYLFHPDDVARKAEELQDRAVERVA
jgi:predicted site-specific integrase-resolvase